MSRTVQSEALIPMAQYADKYPLRIDLAYARTDNLLFGERVYRPQARLYLYEDLAYTVCEAANILGRQDLRLVLYDGLRTVEAQEKMLQTTRVKDNPHWLEEPRLLSPPGAGAHPRGMAVDCAVETQDGTLLDMGTPFDFLAEHSEPAHNPAHRAYKGHPPEIMKNREILDTAMVQAAGTCGLDLLPLPQEWWDFRLPPAIYEQYAPLRDADLPADMRLTGAG